MNKKTLKRCREEYEIKTMYEIKINIVNSILAGALVFAGSFTNGNITKEGIFLSLMASTVVAITKFQNFWKKLINRGKGNIGLFLFNFVG